MPQLPRHIWLLAALLNVLAMLACTFTPVAWVMMGRPAESYPELGFGLYGVPWSLGLLCAAVFVVLKGNNVLSWSSPPMRPLITVTVWQACLPFILIPAFLLKSQTFFELTLLSTWAGLPAIVAALGWLTWKRKRQS